MNNRQRMIARAEKQNRIKQKPDTFTLNDLADAVRKLGNAMQTLATSVEKVIKAMDWSEIAKRLNMEEYENG